MFERCSPAIPLRAVPRPGAALPRRAPRRRRASVAHPPLVGGRRPRHRPGRRGGQLFRNQLDRRRGRPAGRGRRARPGPRHRARSTSCAADARDAGITTLGRDHARRLPPRAPHVPTPSARRPSRARARPATSHRPCAGRAPRLHLGDDLAVVSSIDLTAVVTARDERTSPSRRNHPGPQRMITMSPGSAMISASSTLSLDLRHDEHLAARMPVHEPSCAGGVLLDADGDPPRPSSSAWTR